MITEGSTTKEFGEIDWSDSVLPIRWRDEKGQGNPLWTDAPAHPPLDAAVFPDELRQNSRFTRQGNAFSRGFHTFGDFDTLKGIATDVVENGLQIVHNVLIRSYQYIIAKFDVDAFRIDTLKFLSPDFERIFGNAMREFALSTGRRTSSPSVRSSTTRIRSRSSSGATRRPRMRWSGWTPRSTIPCSSSSPMC